MAGFKQRFYIYCNEEDVVNVLRIVEDYTYDRFARELVVGYKDNLGEDTVWFIHFHANDKDWAKIKPKLQELKTVSIMI